MSETNNADTDMSSSSPLHQPPPSIHHPLHLLDAFLLSVEGNGSIERNEKILKIADFLYGKSSNKSSSSTRRSQNSASSPISYKSSVSILDSAIELLDNFEEESAPSTSSQKKINNGDSNHTGRNSVPIRMLIAKKSRRRVVVVRGSSGSRGRSGTDYLVTLGSPAKIYKRGESKSIAGRLRYHCSCRSFFERIKNDRFALCKHLLAARIAPFLCIEVTDGDGKLHSCIYREEEVDDVEFGRIYAQLALAAY